MPLWEWLLDVAGLLVVLLAAYALGLVVRRRVLSRHGGTFELSHRVRTPAPGRGWLLGLGRYSGDDLEWFRIFSLSPRPRSSWTRSSLSFESRRDPVDGELSALYPGSVVISCRVADDPRPAAELELAMSPASLTGFQAWLEAGPPGVDWSV